MHISCHYYHSIWEIRDARSEKVAKIRCAIVRRARCLSLQMAAAPVPRKFSEAIPNRIQRRAFELLQRTTSKPSKTGWPRYVPSGARAFAWASRKASELVHISKASRDSHTVCEA